MCAYRYGALPVCSHNPEQLKIITVSGDEILRRLNNHGTWRTPEGVSYGRMSVTNALKLARRLTR